MKKITRLFTSAIATASLILIPMSVHAQVEEVPPTNSTPETAAPAPALPSTGGSEVKAPDTGIAPSNKVVQNTLVFAGGSLLGAGAGLGLITLRKNQK